MKNNKRYLLKGGIIGILLPFLIACIFHTFYKMPGPHNDEWFLRHGSTIATFENITDPLHVTSLVSGEFESSPPIVLPEVLVVPVACLLLFLQWAVFGMFFGWLYGKIKNKISSNP